MVNPTLQWYSKVRLRAGQLYCLWVVRALSRIYYIKLNLSVCVCVCVCVCLSACPFVLYTNPQFWADRRETWHEASLEHWAEQCQVGDEPVLVFLIKLNLSVCLCVRLFSIQIRSFGPIGAKPGMRHPWGTGQSKVRLASAPKASTPPQRIASLC